MRLKIRQLPLKAHRRLRVCRKQSRRQEPETQPEAERYVVTGNSVNVRTEPSTSSRILVQLSQAQRWIM